PVAVVSARPGAPGAVAHGMRRRSESQNVNEHRFVVAAPIVTRETFFRRPGERHGRRTRLRPGPVHAAVDLLGQFSDLDFLGILSGEIGLAKEHAAEEQRRVYGRDLAIVVALPALPIDEVIVEPLLFGGGADA